MVIFRNEIKKGVDAWRQVLAVCADSEEVDLVAPELAQALDDRTRSEFGLQIPSRFQGDTLSARTQSCTTSPLVVLRIPLTITSKCFPSSLKSHVFIR
jgi:hypothetical protein